MGTDIILKDRYKILKVIGRGGMSIVYAGWDKRFNRMVAVKELKKSSSVNTKIQLKRVRWEASILKKANHPVLPGIIDIVEEQGKIYLVMDYIQGLPLDRILKDQGAQSWETAAGWARQLAGGLACLHAMNPPVIYRDMKPSNIIIQPDGNVRIIDFGAAKEYRIRNKPEVTALGTRGYAAPEQFGDEYGNEVYKTDIRTDIYNLGATLYHIVMGKNLDESFYDSFSGQLYWEAIILKCIKEKPGERYQNCQEFLVELNCFEESEQMPLPPREISMSEDKTSILVKNK